MTIGFLLTAQPPTRLSAQCPDGSPPPCRTTTSVAGRAPVIPLNENVWLVLPFENTARSADAELIRLSSVSQLQGEMSRWSGVRVIPDERVADLLQTAPAAQRDRPGLETALAMARRIGAGRLVLGGYLAAGGRANVTARVYETRTGRELRVVRDPLAGFHSPAALDSLGASFGRLARGILDVPPASGGASAGVGTSSIDAYRAYTAGMDALNHIDLAGAQRHFDRAIQLDSTFALARFQRWRASETDSAGSRVHLEAAMRMASRLPPRGRALMEGMAAQRRNQRDQLCRSANELVGSDSADAEGWTLLSSCHRDLQVVVEQGVPRVRGDINKAIRAGERAYALAPDALAGQQGLINSLSAGSFMTCVPPATTAICPADNFYRVALLTAGDSIAVSINPWSQVRHAPPDLAPSAVEGQVARYRRAAAVLDRMALAGGLRIVHQIAGSLYLAAGDPAAAEARYGRGTAGPLDSIPANRNGYLQGRFEIALALEKVAEFRAYADSFFARPGIDVIQFTYRSMFGKLGEGLDTNATGRENAAWRQIFVGVLPPNFDSLEQRIGGRLTGPQRDDFYQLGTLAAFHMRRGGPALDTASRHPLKRYQAWFARGDMPRARAALAEFDRELLARHVATADDGGWLFAAESHLELGDTATAFQRMQEFGRRWPASIQGAYLMETRHWQSRTPRLFGRAWTLYGDLAMARGARPEARRAYRMVVGLWDGGDPVVQPMVTRAKAALQQLGS